MKRDLHLTAEKQIDMFSQAGRYGVVGTGAARRYFDNAQPGGCIAEVTSVHEYVHEITLKILNGEPRRASSKSGHPRYAAIGSGCSARVYPVTNVNDTTLQIIALVGGQDFFQALIERILSCLDAHFTAEGPVAVPYTSGTWLAGIGPPEHQGKSGPPLDTRITSADGGIIATFEVGRYAPGTPEESAGNARRAAACVNRLRGVSTEMLEQLPDGLLCHLIESHFSIPKAA